MRQVQLVGALGEPTGGIVALGSAAQDAGADQAPQGLSGGVLADNPR